MEYRDWVEATYAKVIEKFGIVHQATVAIEEAAELTKELTKFVRTGKPNIMHLAEEIADMEVCIAQLKQHFELEQSVDLFKRFKLERLEHFYLEGGQL